MKPYPKIVVIRRDGQDGSEYPITSGRCVFGSAPECDIRMRTEGTEGKHCMVVIDSEKQAHLISVSGTAALRVRGQPVSSEAPLSHGDVFEVEERRFRFEWCKGSNPATPGCPSAAPKKSLGQSAHTPDKKSQRSSATTPLGGGSETRVSTGGSARRREASPIATCSFYNKSRPEALTPRLMIHDRVASLREKTPRPTPRRSCGAAASKSEKRAVRSSDRGKSAALMSIHGSRRWADVVAQGIAKKTPVRVEKHTFRIVQKRRKLRSMAAVGRSTPRQHIGSTGHANSPATIIVGKSRLRKSTPQSSPNISQHATPSIPTEVFVSPLSNAGDEWEESPEPMASGSSMLKTSSGSNLSFSLVKTGALRSAPTPDGVVGLRRILRRSTPSANYTRVSGVKRVLQRGTPTADYTRVSGVKRMYQKGTPEADYTDPTGVKRMYRKGTPEADYTDPTGVKRMYRKGTPKADYSDVAGIKRLVARSPRNSYSNLEGVQQLVETPRKDDEKQTDAGSSSSARRSGGLASATVQDGGNELSKAGAAGSSRNTSPQKPRGRPSLRKTASPSVERKLTRSRADSAKKPNVDGESDLEGVEPPHSPEKSKGSASLARRSGGVEAGMPEAGGSRSLSPKDRKQSPSSPAKSKESPRPTRKSDGLGAGASEGNPSRPASPAKSPTRGNASVRKSMEAKKFEHTQSPSRSPLSKGTSLPTRKSAGLEEGAQEGSPSRRTSPAKRQGNSPMRKGTGAKGSAPGRSQTESEESSCPTRNSVKLGGGAPERNPSGPSSPVESPRRGKSTRTKDLERSPPPKKGKGTPLPKQKGLGDSSPSRPASPAKRPTRRDTPVPKSKGANSKEWSRSPSLSPTKSESLRATCGNVGLEARAPEGSPSIPASLAKSPARGNSPARKSTQDKDSGLSGSPSHSPMEPEESSSPTRSRAGTASGPRRAGTKAGPTRKSAVQETKATEAGSSQTRSSRSTRIKVEKTETSPQRVGTRATRRASETSPKGATRSTSSGTAQNVEAGPAGSGSVDARERRTRGSRVVLKVSSGQDGPQEREPPTSRKRGKTSTKDLAEEEPSSIEATRENAPVRGRPRTKRNANEAETPAVKSEGAEDDGGAPETPRKTGTGGATTSNPRGKSSKKRPVDAEAADDKDAPSGAVQKKGAKASEDAPTRSAKKNPTKAETAAEEDVAHRMPRRRGTRGRGTPDPQEKSPKKDPVDAEPTDGKEASSRGAQKRGAKASEEASTRAAQRDSTKGETGADGEAQVGTPRKRGRGARASKSTAAQCTEESSLQRRTTRSGGVSSGTPRGRGTRTTRASLEKRPTDAGPSQDEGAHSSTPQKRDSGAKAVPPSKSPKKRPADPKRVKGEASKVAPPKKTSRADVETSEDEPANPKKTRTSARTAAASSPAPPRRATRAAGASKSESESPARSKSPRKRTKGSASTSPQRPPAEKDAPAQKRSKRGDEASPARAAASGSKKGKAKQSPQAKSPERAPRRGRTRTARAAETQPADDVSEELGSVDSEVTAEPPARRSGGRRGAEAAAAEEEPVTRGSRRVAAAARGRRGAIVEGLVDMRQMRDLRVMLSPIRELSNEQLASTAPSSASRGATRRTTTRKAK